MGLCVEAMNWTLGKYLVRMPGSFRCQVGVEVEFDFVDEDDAFVVFK